MTLYVNTKKDADIASVESILLGEGSGNFTFFSVKTPEKAEALKAWLTGKERQEIIAETTVGGNTMLITRGEKSQEELFAALKDAGDTVKPYEPEKEFNAWKWRGTLSNVGQTLNLISGYRKPGGLDVPKLSFAGMNFAASYMNATFGGQKVEDEHRMRYVKQSLNALLGGYLPEGVKPPAADDDRMEERTAPPPPPTMKQQAYGWLKANSVSVGEIGFRIGGSVALAFPLKNWKGAARELQAGSVQRAFHAASNKDRTNFFTGGLYLIGKFIGLTTKVPDPYNPEPHTQLDTIREKYVFRLSSAIESGAAATLALGNLRPKKGKPDYIGAAGGGVLTGGLLTRLLANFGTRTMDMDEIYAHATDILAEVPPADRPQAIADAAAELATHFQDKNYGKIYTRMMSELYRYHNVALHHDNAPQAGPARAMTENKPRPEVEVASCAQAHNAHEPHFATPA